MRALKARVENGRIKLDEPTDLPEGELVELVPLNDVIANGGDDLDDEERAALHRSIDESIDDEQAGNVEDLSKIIAELRERPHPSSGPGPDFGVKKGAFHGGASYVFAVSDPAQATKPDQRLFRYPVDLGPAELGEIEQALPDDVTAHHLRWLETGEGKPWPESSD